jgi:PAS domain S-box-containing protein
VSEAVGHVPEERQLALLVSQAVDYAIFMLDPDGFITTWNPGAERMKGYRRDEIVGRHFSVFYTEEDRARDHPATVLRTATGEGRYEEEGWRVRQDGSRFWANIVITALRDENGALVGFGKVSRDLTARHLTEERARAKTLALESANRELAEFRRLVSSVRDYAIFMLDPAGHVLSWNAGARYLKGYEPEEIVGRHFSIFYTAEDRERDHTAHELRMAARDGSYEEEGWRIRKDGSRFWAGVTITAVRDEDGRLTGFAKVTRDLTERRRTEQALQKAVEEMRHANEELDRFATVAAHDMADPLRTISGFAELLLQSPGGEDATEYAQHIHDSSGRLATMLQALLTYARAGRAPAASVPVVLAETVAQVRRDLAASIEERHAAVAVALPEGARVLTERGDLRIVLQNLIANAIKFADGSAPAVAIDAERHGDRWCVSVRDNGRGIATEDQQRIFGAFERASSETGGYGLGLATCLRLVERHGGRIGVDSAPGRETRFWFTLPAGN